ncbi:MAG: hypothetical protein ABI574_01740 [Burkholderiales bacterium]
MRILSALSTKPADRALAIVVLTSTSWPRIERLLPAVISAIAAAVPGSYREVVIART